MSSWTVAPLTTTMSFRRPRHRVSGIVDRRSLEMLLGFIFSVFDVIRLLYHQLIIFEASVSEIIHIVLTWF